LLQNAHVLIRAMYGGTALAFRDRLIMDWNKTQQNHTFADHKRIYCE
jgi:starch phosphorylase